MKIKVSVTFQTVIMFLVFCSAIIQERYALTEQYVLNSYFIRILLLIVVFSALNLILYIYKSRSIPNRLLNIILFYIYAVFLTSLDSSLNMLYLYAHGFAWPLVFISFYLYSSKQEITKTMRGIILAGLVVFAALLPANIREHLVGAGNYGTAIGPLYYCLGFLAMVFVCFNNKIIRSATALFTMIFITASTKRVGIIAIYFGLMMAYVTYLHIQGNSRKKIFRVLVFFLLMCLTVVAGYYWLTRYNTVLLNRFLSLSGDGGSGRDRIWNIVWNAFVNESFVKKIFGNGYHAVVYKLNIWSRGIMAHNSYLETLYDFGISGVLFLIGHVVILVKDTYSAVKEKNLNAPIMVYMIICVIIVSCTGYFFEQSITILPFAVAWGILLGEQRRCKEIVKK